MSYGRSSTDLALVYARVLFLRIFYPQRPVFRVRFVDGLESLIAGVRVASRGQQVYVAMSDPRDLEQIFKTLRITTTPRVFLPRHRPAGKRIT